ncbi:EthD family reductase [Cereibacter sphaeroides]|uniref:EthD family reductase n=1 Tax=Cereibacter sphaeroides TaxID=1063 RepID=UPI001F21D702|nr:EthD family reductase [Cereibacter sphaeroides]MCE6949584.1 EthD family reductase [Cereibacter sphaeroides]
MARLLVMYRKPEDEAAFDRHYSDIHIGLAQKMPGLKGYEISRGPVQSPGGPSPYHLVAILTFDDTAAVTAALESPEGQAAVEDVGRFATGGVDILIFDDQPAAG